MNVVDIARICHEANRALCETQNDPSQKGWEDAPEWQRSSALLGVMFTRDNPDAPPSANHESWHAQKLAEGWRWGLVKDPEAKTHPCMVPFDQLPPEQQAKDHLFKAIARSLLPFATAD